VGAMEIEEMVILDDGLRILLFLEERLSSLHDDVGVVVLFDRITQENLFVSAAQGFLRGTLILGCARAGGGDTEYHDTEAEGRCKSRRGSQLGKGTYHHWLKM